MIVYLPSPNNDSPSFCRRNSSQLDFGMSMESPRRDQGNLSSLLDNPSNNSWASKTLVLDRIKKSIQYPYI